MRLDGSLMPFSLRDRLGRRPELGRDPDQRVAGLDLVGPRRRRRRTRAVRRRATRPGSAAASLGPADVGSVAARRRPGRAALAVDGAGRAPTTPRSGDRRRPTPPPVSRARTIAANARASRTISTAWPVDRSERRIGHGDREAAVVEDDRGRAGDGRGSVGSAVVADRPCRAGGLERRARRRGRRSGTGGAASRRRAAPAARPRRSDARGRPSCCARRRRPRQVGTDARSPGVPVARTGRARRCGRLRACGSTAVIAPRIAGTGSSGPARRSRDATNRRGNAKIPATTYFPERLPSQYLRRWRA